MFKSNFRLLLRSLWRNKSFSLLNIGGLAVGIAVSLLIFLLIGYELSVDSWHSKRDRIYRVCSIEFYRNGTTDYDGCAPIPLADALRREFPQAEEVAHVWRAGSWPFTLPGAGGDEKLGAASYKLQGGGGKPQSRDDRYVKVDNIFFADTPIFKIFDMPWLAGDPGTALKDEYTMAIARHVAESWFGHWQDAMGKTVFQGEDRRPWRITGVMEDARPNTDISLNVVLSYPTYRAWHKDDMANPMSWDNFSTSSQCFFLLRKGQTIASMEALLPPFVATHFTPLYQYSNSRDSCFFQPLKEMHLATGLDRYGRAAWSSSELWSMGLIGAFLLIVACINFINLATAQSLGRAKEVGVRKVLGSRRGQLMLSFLRETGLLVLVSMVLGCLLTQLALPSLRLLLGKPVALDGSLPTVLFLFCTWVLVTFLAGFYPGMVLSRFNPISAFKGKVDARVAGGISLRRGLLVLQFAIAQLLIIGTLVVVQQMKYFHSRPMGFERKAIALVGLPWSKDNITKNAYFQQRALQVDGIRSASLCSNAPSTESVGSSSFVYENHPHPEGFELQHRAGDPGYISLFNIELVSGRHPYSSDTARQEECLLNQTAVRMLGSTPGEVLGKHIRQGMKGKPISVVGVVRDFNSSSLRGRIKPLAIYSSAERFGMLAIKLEPSKMRQALKQLQAAYDEVYPGNFFNTVFFDESVADFYHAEQIAATLFKIFAGLAIFISCLGLYGLVSYMAVQKTKEVGVRKVLGASVADIVYMFSKEFTVLIVVAFLVAAPLGYYFMHRWLSGYFYHISPGWDVFAVAIVSSVVMAWATVGYKAVKAALANPVKSLRSE